MITFAATLGPPLSGGFTGLGLHPSPPKPDTHAGRLASAPSPMIDRESGDLGTINHRTLEPEEPSRPFKSYPTLPLSPRSRWGQRLSLDRPNSLRHVTPSPCPAEAVRGQEGLDSASAGARLCFSPMGPLAPARPDSAGDLGQSFSPVQTSDSPSVKSRGLTSLACFVEEWTCRFSENSQVQQTHGAATEARARAGLWTQGPRC